MSDIPSLLSRVRAASGPDRELDADIWRALCWKHHSREIAKGTPFTGSIDAAVALVERVLPGWHAEIGCGNSGRVAWCVLYEFPEPCRRVPKTGVILGDIAPLAILAALLSALEQKESAG